MPSSVSNSITLPRSIGPSAVSAYFLGMSGSLSLNSSISVTYFSSKFTLTNMTGPSSAIPSTSSTPVSSSVASTTTSSGRLIVCTSDDGDAIEGETGGLGGIVNQACELAALAVISILAMAATITTTATRTSSIIQLTTTPPAVTGYAAQIITTSASSLSSTATGTARLSSTSSITSQSAIGTSTASSSATSSHQNSKMVYCLVIAGLTLATVIALFWIWRRYRSVKNYCDHFDCDHPEWRKKFDRILRPVPMKKLVEPDSEKGPIITPIEAAPPAPFISVPTRTFESEREAEAEAMAIAASMAAATRRQRFEEAMGKRASRRSSRASRKTILAELEGDLGVGGEDIIPIPPMPPVPVDTESRDLLSDLASRRKTMVGQGQQEQ